MLATIRPTYSILVALTRERRKSGVDDPLGPAGAGLSTAEREEEKEPTQPYMSAKIGMIAQYYSNLRAFWPEPREEKETKQQEQFCLQD